MLISRTLLFELNVTLMSVFNLIVLLSYRVIRVFLVQKIQLSHSNARARYLVVQ